MAALPIDIPADTLNAVNHGPFAFPGVHTYMITIKTEPEKLQQLVPSPLVANSDGLFVIVVAQYLNGVETPTERIAGYNEVVLVVPATYTHPDGRRERGGYTVALYLADREPQSVCDPTVLGLMLPGYPKRTCVWQESVRDGRRHLRIARRNVDVLDMVIVDAEPQPLPPNTGSGGANFVLKYVPSINRNIAADVLKLNAVRGGGGMTHAAPVEVAFNSQNVRLDSGIVLPVLGVLSAIRGYMDMGNGDESEELIDYLA